MKRKKRKNVDERDRILLFFYFIFIFNFTWIYIALVGALVSPLSSPWKPPHTDFSEKRSCLNQTFLLFLFWFFFFVEKESNKIIINFLFLIIFFKKLFVWDFWVYYSIFMHLTLGYEYDPCLLVNPPLSPDRIARQWVTRPELLVTHTRQSGGYCFW